ncbi:hypothetical protein DP939_23955 [Spongiactinospora rosea]|uniref:MYXO-CTERM domain-containing protein n=1 Tax=Spongiactinospora rosea TaxID=2248750 RepID=A0A366LV32_9ACTN|nr:hypothetical protein [Spongiactinospora rosea]RBQ17450.1 hypothetical protein DP939_23955 [Spongiactinospora rosea]
MRRVSAFDVVVMACGLALIALAAQNLGPALAAARGDGTPGTFTAAQVECISHPGHEQCTWMGEFRSDDGTVRRAGIGFYGSDRAMFAPGRHSRAFDTGRPGHVYGPGGSNEWIVVALLMAAGAALAAWPLVRRRGRARQLQES